MPDNPITLIADTYLEQTGKLLLTPLEYGMIAEWLKAEIPLFVILNTLEELGVWAKEKGIAIRGLQFFDDEILARAQEHWRGTVGS